MAGRDRIVRTLSVVGQTTESAWLTNRGESFPAPRQHLVGVTLVANIPYQPVARTIKDVVQGQGQFHAPEIRGQVPAILRYNSNDLVAHMRRDFLQFGNR